MKPSEVRERLAVLREAGAALRRRPGAEVVEIVAAVLDRWRDPEGPERRALERDLPGVTGFTPAVVRAGLAHALAAWDGDALRAIAARDLRRGDDLARGPDTTAVLLGGAIPMPSLLGVLEPLVMRSAVLAKTASRDPLTATLVQRSLAALDPGLACCLALVDFPGADGACTAAFLEADAVVVTGSDSTVEAVARRVSPPRRVLRHGHKLSIAVVGPGAAAGEALANTARGLALDTALWDQQGCLSPVSVYVLGDLDAARTLGAALADALAVLATDLPRGETEPAADALAAHERAGAELRAAAGTGVFVHTGEGGAWTVVVETDATPRPMPLQRFLRVHPVASHDALEDALAPLGPQLAGVASAGLGGPDQAWVNRRVRALGAAYCCAPGSLQAPPLDWPRDGVPAFAALEASAPSGDAR